MNFSLRFFADARIQPFANGKSLMLWVKSFHILFVMAWMAGLFYLPRILVHHSEGLAAGEDTRRLSTMANKLFRFSLVMATIAIVLGTWLWLAWGFGGNWLYAKLGFVGLLMAYQYQCWRFIGRMAEGKVIHTSLYFRLFNESALLLVIPVILLVEFKPF
jgi:putative membrane protein